MQILACRYIHQLPSLTEQALALTGTTQLQSLASGTDTAGATSALALASPLLQSGSASSSSQGVPSWLTPQQLQNRQLGEQDLC